MRREDLARDLLRDLERKPEPRRRFPEQAAPEVVGRELVEGEVAADRRERFGVLAETVRFELLFREPATGKVPLARVDLAEPALVFPRAAADPDVLRGQ